MGTALGTLAVWGAEGVLTPQSAPLTLGLPALLLCVSGSSVLGPALILFSASSPLKSSQSPFSSQVGERGSADSRGHSWEIFSQGSGWLNTQACQHGNAQTWRWLAWNSGPHTGPLSWLPGHCGNLLNALIKDKKQSPEQLGRLDSLLLRHPDFTPSLCSEHC